jgi:hypothetical protein
MKKRKRRQVLLASTATVHERRFAKAVTDALSLANSVIRQVNTGNCHGALDTLLRLEKARGIAEAHTESGSGKRAATLATQVSITHARIGKAISAFGQRCKVDSR